MLALYVLAFFLCSKNIYAWSGFDWSKGSYVEIEKGELVREGEEVEIFDYGDGEYKDIEIDSMNKYGNHVEIEGTDIETGEIRTFDMD